MRTALVLVALLLAGCTDALKLRHPVTGQTATCGPYYSFGLYYIMATERERTCVSDFQRQGYERVPEGAAQPPTRVASTATPSGGLSGTFTGDISGIEDGQPFAMRVTFTVVQNGDALAGAWTSTGGTSGTVSGTIAEQRLTNFRVRQLNPCGGELVGAAAIEAGGNQLRGAYAGTACGSTVKASFLVTRQ